MLHLTARDELRGLLAILSKSRRHEAFVTWISRFFTHLSSPLFLIVCCLFVFLIVAVGLPGFSWRGSPLLAHSHRLRAFYDTWDTPQCYNQDDEILLCQLHNLRKWKVFVQTPSRSSSHFQKLSGVPSFLYRNKPLASPAHKAHIRPYHSPFLASTSHFSLSHHS